jgi:hypothetical protein
MFGRNGNNDITPRHKFTLQIDISNADKELKDRNYENGIKASGLSIGFHFDCCVNAGRIRNHDLILPFHLHKRRLSNPALLLATKNISGGSVEQNLNWL